MLVQDLTDDGEVPLVELGDIDVCSMGDYRLKHEIASDASKQNYGNMGSNLWV